MRAAPAASPVRRPAPAPQAARPAARPAPAFKDASDGEDVIRLQLSDLPRVQETLDVEGFKPTLLSRLFDLIAPIKKR